LVRKILISILAIFLIIICIGPLIFVIWNSPKTVDEYTMSKFSMPKNPGHYIENFNALIDYGIFKYMLNSLIVVVITITLCAIFSSMAGYAFSKLEFKGKNMIFWTIIGTLTMPAQVFIIPLFVMFSRLDLINNFFSIAVIYSTFSFAFGVFFMRSFYAGIPTELCNAAKVDGANSFDIYLKIMLPLGKPAIVTYSVLCFFVFWNELFLSMIFLRDVNVRTVTPGMAMIKQGVTKLTDWPLIFSAVIPTLIIPIAIYIMFQNRLASGITIGALKE